MSEFSMLLNKPIPVKIEISIYEILQKRLSDLNTRGKTILVEEDFLTELLEKIEGKIND